MYQALYRKWRPKTFSDVVGQEHVTETLQRQVAEGRLSHAYLFTGTRGTGKTTCAKILAKAVNCEHPENGNPCNKCSSCLGIESGGFLDVMELDAASNNGVDHVRALRDEAIYSPAQVKKRVYIIDEVHMLSASAFNALLKILEEPPEHLMFILATTELQKVPATILSRCQRHSFRRIDTPQIAEYLEYIARQEQFSLTHDAAELIARLADGGVRDALSLLDQCSAFETIDAPAVYSAMGLAGNKRITDMLDHILRHDAPAALEEFSALWMDGKDPATFLRELGTLLRDVLISVVAPKSGMSLLTGGYDAASLADFAGRMTREELISAMETVQRYSAQLREAKNPKTVVELCLISLCDNTLGEDVNALRARISRLEAIAAGSAAPSTVTAPAASAPAPAAAPAPTERPAPKPEPIPAPIPTPPPEEEAPPLPEDPAAVPPSADGELWSAVCAAVSPKLTPDLRYVLGDSTKVRGRMENGVLHVDCLPGFVYGRFNRQEVLDSFAAAASRKCGRDVRVILGELGADAQSTRSVEELRQFKEVRFI